VWSQERRRERQAYYRSETLEKLADSATAGQKLGGLITFAVGIGLMIFIKSMDRSDPVYLVGLIPLFIGAALLAYAYSLAPKQ